MVIERDTDAYEIEHLNFSQISADRSSSTVSTRQAGLFAWIFVVSVVSKPCLSRVVQRKPAF
jgi:hypothetical protein